MAYANVSVHRVLSQLFTGYKADVGLINVYVCVCEVRNWATWNAKETLNMIEQ